MSEKSDEEHDDQEQHDHEIRMFAMQEEIGEELGEVAHDEANKYREESSI